MIITNRQRLQNQGRSYSKKQKSIPINFDLSSLDLLCNFVISENRNVRRLQYINLRNLISMINLEPYISDQERYKRILFIKKGLEARLDRNLQDRIMILDLQNKFIFFGI